MAAVPVTVFSDFLCPFCYLTEAALWRLEDEGLAGPSYRAYELHPAPGLPRAVAFETLEAARPLAEALGLDLRLPVAAHTRKAHEAARFAASKGMGRAFREAVYAAAFAQGRDVGRIDVLVELGAELGLDATELKVVLDVDTFTGDVEADEALARRWGVGAVPALLVGEGTRAQALVGAFGYADLRDAVAAAG